MSRVSLYRYDIGSAVLRHSADLLWIAPGARLVLASDSDSVTTRATRGSIPNPQPKAPSLQPQSVRFGWLSKLRSVFGSLL